MKTPCNQRYHTILFNILKIRIGHSTITNMWGKYYTQVSKREIINEKTLKLYMYKSEHCVSTTLIYKLKNIPINRFISSVEYHTELVEN